MFVPPRVRPPRSLCFSILFITIFKWNVSSPKTKCQHFPMSWALRNYLLRFFCWKRSRKIWNFHLPGPSKLFSISPWTAFERVSFHRGGREGGGCIWWKVVSLTWGLWHDFWVTLSSVRDETWWEYFPVLLSSTYKLIFNQTKERKKTLKEISTDIQVVRHTPPPPFTCPPILMFTGVSRFLQTAWLEKWTRTSEKEKH